MSRCCAKDNKGIALPSACDSGVVIPEWGVPERVGWENYVSPPIGVQKYSSWQLAEADTLLRYEYNHLDDFDDGMGPGVMQVTLLLASDAEGTDEEAVAQEIREVPYSESGKWFSVAVEMIVPAGVYYRISVFHPVITSPQDSLLPGGVSKYQYNFITLSSMENQP